MYYILGVSRGDPWILSGVTGDTCPTIEEAQRRIAFQGRAYGADREQWEVCTRVGPASFVSLSGDSYEVPTRGIYTVEAWGRFLATWPHP